MAVTDDDQHLLFGDDPIARALADVGAAPHLEHAAHLAALLPKHIRLGTSSWNFPGWRGLVYSTSATESNLPRAGLSAYGSHPLFRTVGLDRSFYTPQTPAALAHLAALVPTDFRFLVKARQSITRPYVDERGQTFGDTGHLRHAGLPNPRFLDPGAATDLVIGPTLAGLRAKTGPILFQFPHLTFAPDAPRAELRTPAAFIDALAAFLGRLPRPLPPAFIAVETRSAEILAPDHAARYAAALTSARAAHGFLWHPTMPPITDQAHTLRQAGAPPETFPGLCIRWVLRHDSNYEEAGKRYQPFDHLIDEDPVARAQIADLLRTQLPPGREAFTIVNNNAEGSAPLTIEKLAEDLVR